MRVLITRPIEDAKPLADALAERNVDVLIEPLLEITEFDDVEIDLQGVQAVLFTSANGVRAFAGLSPHRSLKAFTVGDGSAEAARRAGFVEVESAKGDIEALAALVVDRLKPDDGLLFHAAGTVTAGDLKSRLEGLGYQVRRAQLYDAKIATALSTETRANLTLGGIDAVLLFSPRTARTFAELWRAAGAPSLAAIEALCLSAAVVREIDTLGWGGVEIAERPDLPSMLALVDAAEQKVARKGAAQKGPSMADSPTREAEPAADTTMDDAARAARGDDAARAAQADTIPPLVEPAAPAPRRRGGGSILFYIALSLIAAALAVVSAPFWQPHVNSLLGLRQASAPVTDDRLTALQGDVQALSEQVQAAIDAGALNEAIAAAIDPLAAEIAGAKQELAALKTDFEAMRAYLPSAAVNPGTLAELPNVDLTPLENRIAQLETSLNETSARLGELSATQTAAQAETGAESAPAPTPAPDPRVDALGIENQSLRDQIAMLTQRLDELSALDAKVQELEPRLTALGDQVANMPKGAEQQRAAALIVAIGELRSALASDKSFTPELSALNDLTHTDDVLRPRLKPIVDELAPLAEAGVPTLSQLAAGFPATDIARAGEAELATEVADDAWYKRLWHGTVHALSEVFTLRPVGPDVEGEGTLPRLARAEAKLGEGDLGGAVTELRGLSGLAAETAVEWLALAEARLTIERVAAQLADISTRELAPQAGE